MTLITLFDEDMPKGCASCKHMINCDMCYGLQCFCPLLMVDLGYQNELPGDRRDDCPLAPATDVQPVVRGKWEWRGFNIRCPFCGFEPMFDSTEPLYNYCPNCGAEMREQEGDA